MPTVPLLASVADLNASVTAGGASQLVPSGVVMAFAGATAPTGWLLCNGAAVSRVTYADLFAAIGTAHGYGDNVAVTGTFNLPDYRGRFIRGRDTMGTAATRDPDKAGRTQAATGGATGDAVGSVQGNATSKNGLTVTNNAVTSGNQSADHTHSGTTNNSTVPSNNVSGADNATGLSGSGNSSVNPQNNSGSHSHSFTTGGVSTNHSHSVTSNVVLNSGDNETRPLNAYVNYIIKI